MLQRLLRAAASYLPAASPLQVPTAGDDAARLAREEEHITKPGGAAHFSSTVILDDLSDAHAFAHHGVYIFPDTCDALIWHGVAVARDGSAFAGGVFRFIVCIHPLYPSEGAIPLLVWLEPPWHPAVDPASGLMNLASSLPSRRWSRAQRLSAVTDAVRDVMHAPAITHMRDVHYNVEAADECVSRPHVYAASAHACAVASRGAARGATSTLHWDAASPYSAATAAFMAAATVPLTRSQLMIVRAVADIGYARGFRFPPLDALQTRVLRAITRLDMAVSSDQVVADAIVNACAASMRAPHVARMGDSTMTPLPPQRDRSRDADEEATRKAEAAIAALDEDLAEFQLGLDARA